MDLAVATYNYNPSNRGQGIFGTESDIDHLIIYLISYKLNHYPGLTAFQKSVRQISNSGHFYYTSSF